jgi:hypothetical protein
MTTAGGGRGYTSNIGSIIDYSSLVIYGAIFILFLFFWFVWVDKSGSTHHQEVLIASLMK